MLGKKSPDSCTREKMLKRGYDKVGRVNNAIILISRGNTDFIIHETKIKVFNK